MRKIHVLPWRVHGGPGAIRGCMIPMFKMIKTTTTATRMRQEKVMAAPAPKKTNRSGDPNTRLASMYPNKVWVQLKYERSGNQVAALIR